MEYQDEGWRNPEAHALKKCGLSLKAASARAPSKPAGPAKVVAAVATGSVAARLTPEQIKNWRNVLCGTIGPYALIMPDADVQRLRDQLQAKMGGPQNARGVPDARGPKP